ncbi:MAG: hypothetical protein ACOC53_01765 [Candidatus Saliniplasma sp.]
MWGMIFDLLILLFVTLYISKDVRKREFDNRIFLMWMVGIIIAYIFLTVWGVFMVLIIYFIWTVLISRKLVSDKPDAETEIE